MLTFTPNFAVIAETAGTFSIADMERETGVYSANPEFVRANCGPIANRLLDLIPGAYYDKAERLKLWPNCDVRIHRLYPGDFPAYPGWHCDGEFRETYFAQPDLDRIGVSDHITATVSTGQVCSPQFLDEAFCCEVDNASDVALWGQVDCALLKRQRRLVWDSRDGQMVQFDCRTLHRAMPALTRGWRLFFRMSMWHKPNLGNGGMVTRQEQVYKLAEFGGW